MRVSYTLTLKDMFEAQGKHGGWRMKALPIFGLPLFAIGLVNLIHDPTQAPSPVAIVATGVFLMFFVKLQVWLSFRGDKRLQDQFEADISDSGIDISSSKLATKYDWSAFIRYTETKNLFLIYQTPQCFNIFPKRALPLGQVDALRTLLDQRLGAASTAYRKQISPLTWTLLIIVALVAIFLAVQIYNALR